MYSTQHPFTLSSNEATMTSLPPDHRAAGFRPAYGPGTNCATAAMIRACPRPPSASQSRQAARAVCRPTPPIRRFLGCLLRPSPDVCSAYLSIYSEYSGLLATFGDRNEGGFECLAIGSIELAKDLRVAIEENERYMVD